MSTLYVTEPPTDGKILLHTSKGEIEIELWAKEAPKACRNIVTLALEGYYDACIWHRIVPGFIIQTGDPTGTGAGGESIYGHPFVDEQHQRLRFNRRGLVAMANTGMRNSNDSQFFITLDATPELQGKHTIFGRVAGTTIYNAMALSEVELSPDIPDRPLYPPKLLRVEVVHNPFPDIVPRITREEKEAQAAARKRLMEERSGDHNVARKKKNTTLLSFGEEEEVAPVPRATRKPISSHDLLDDKRLSKKAMARAVPDAPPAPAPESAKPAAPPLQDPEAGTAPQPSPVDTLQAEIQRDARSGVVPKRAAANASAGRDLLASITAQYKSGQATKGAKKSETHLLSRLDAFRKTIRSTEPDAEDAARAHGASDDDDVDTGGNWRDHRFDSGGVPLTGSTDRFSVDDYEVVDSRDTSSALAASLGFGGSDAVKEQAQRTREQAQRTHGRRGRDWT